MIVIIIKQHTASQDDANTTNHHKAGDNDVDDTKNETVIDMLL